MALNTRTLSMTTSPAATSEYMLLFRTQGWERDLSSNDIQRIMDRTMAWFERLNSEGKVKAAQPLFEEGRIVSGKKGQNVSDGPFVESKEAIAGYLLLKVDTLDEAVAIAQQWPMLECGSTAEVRPVAEQCPSFQRALEQQMANCAA